MELVFTLALEKLHGLGIRLKAEPGPGASEITLPISGVRCSRLRSRRWRLGSTIFGWVWVFIELLNLFGQINSRG
jgi:hypothetical protein